MSVSDLDVDVSVSDLDVDMSVSDLDVELLSLELDLELLSSELDVEFLSVSSLLKVSVSQLRSFFLEYYPCFVLFLLDY